MIESISIVYCGRGWIAHLRFFDPVFDIDMSHANKPQLYYNIESYVRRKVGDYASL